MLLAALYLLTGIGAGLLAGLFGIGGGLVIVPLLLLLLNFADAGIADNLVVHMTIGSSLTIIIFTAATSAWQHGRQQSVLWSDAAWMSPGLVGGAILGAFVAARLDGNVLSVVIGIFAILTALQMSLGPQPQSGRNLGRRQLLPAGACIGTASTLFGIGGGSLTVPFLHWGGRDMHSAIGTSAVCALPVALTGSVAFAINGWGADTPAWSTGYIYWPAVLGISLSSMPAARMGARIAGALAKEHLRRGFAAYLLLVGLYLIIRATGYWAG